MGGLKNIFLKLTPIMFLICCICYGLMHTFQTQDNPPITYLTTETINIGTEEQPENKTLYKFDMPTYVNNIDQDILKRSVSDVFDFRPFIEQRNSMSAIWEDGYQLFDVTKTIANALIFVINVGIFGIDLLLIPVRIIAGILLTGFSIIGININNGPIISPFLTFILDSLNIPLIDINAEGTQGGSEIEDTELNGRVYNFNKEINSANYEAIAIEINFAETTPYTYNEALGIYMYKTYDYIQIARYGQTTPFDGTYYYEITARRSDTLATTWETFYISYNFGNGNYPDGQKTIRLFNNYGRTIQEQREIIRIFNKIASYING